MITEITTIKHVKQFVKDLIAEGCIFHPDDDFNAFVDLETKEHCFTAEEADFRNHLMNRCFAVCEKEQVDIYEIMSNN